MPQIPSLPRANSLPSIFKCVREDLTRSRSCPLVNAIINVAIAPPFGSSLKPKPARAVPEHNEAFLYEKVSANLFNAEFGYHLGALDSEAQVKMIERLNEAPDQIFALQAIRFNAKQLKEEAFEKLLNLNIGGPCKTVAHLAYLAITAVSMTEAQQMRLAEKVLDPARAPLLFVVAIEANQHKEMRDFVKKCLTHAADVPECKPLLQDLRSDVQERKDFYLAWQAQILALLEPANLSLGYAVSDSDAGQPPAET